MSMGDEREGSRLTIEVEPELGRRIEAAAAERRVSVGDYVVAALREALDGDRAARASGEATAWSQLSARSFARDWESDADAAYDDLA